MSKRNEDTVVWLFYTIIIYLVVYFFPIEHNVYFVSILLYYKHVIGNYNLQGAYYHKDHYNMTT